MTAPRGQGYRVLNDERRSDQSRHHVRGAGARVREVHERLHIRAARRLEEHRRRDDVGAAPRPAQAAARNAGTTCTSRSARPTPQRSFSAASTCTARLDSGATFASITGRANTVHVDQHALTFDPRAPTRCTPATTAGSIVPSTAARRGPRSTRTSPSRSSMRGSRSTRQRGGYLRRRAGQRQLRVARQCGVDAVRGRRRRVLGVRQGGHNRVHDVHVGIVESRQVRRDAGRRVVPQQRDQHWPTAPSGICRSWWIP